MLIRLRGRGCLKPCDINASYFKNKNKQSYYIYSKLVKTLTDLSACFSWPLRPYDLTLIEYSQANLKYPKQWGSSGIHLCKSGSYLLFYQQETTLISTQVGI